MIIIQNLNKDVIALYSTVTGFVREEPEAGKSVNYINAMLKEAKGKAVKYKRFLITSMDPVKGKKSSKIGDYLS